MFFFKNFWDLTTASNSYPKAEGCCDKNSSTLYYSKTRHAARRVCARTPIANANSNSKLQSRRLGGAPRTVAGRDGCRAWATVDISRFFQLTESADFFQFILSHRILLNPRLLTSRAETHCYRKFQRQQFNSRFDSSSAGRSAGSFHLQKVLVYSQSYEN